MSLSERLEALSPSPLLFERFEVVRELGAGGSGRVLLCRDTTSGEVVALKELLRLGGDALVHFKREFRVLADIQHPNLVRLGELFEGHGRWGFTLEYVPGHDASTWVRGGTVNDNGFDEERLRRLLAGLATGLSAIHGLGIVHCDVKPENVRVTPEGRVVLLDFGVSLRELDEGVTGERVSGTASFMAPEQARGDKAGPAADWYAVGVMLYEALTGRLPFEGGSIEVLLAKQTQEPPPPSSLALGVPRDLEDLCMALLSRQPAERPGAEAIMAGRSGAPSDGRHRLVADSMRVSEVFLGREQELRELSESFTRSRRQGVRLALVEGESGIGKTALLRQAAAQLRRSMPDLLVLEGRCHAAEQLHYKAFDSAVDELSRYLKDGGAVTLMDHFPSDAHLLPTLFPALGRVPAIAHAPSERKEGRTRGVLFRAFADLLARVADRVPVLLVLDDLQWADEASLALLEALLDEAPGPRLLIAATARPLDSLEGPMRQRLARLADQPNACRLSLEHLTASDAKTLVSELLGDEDEERVRRIAAESGGHPLFVGELVRHARERGDNAVDLDLDSAILSRVSQLDEHALKALVMSCLASGPLPYTVLATASGIPHEPLRVALAGLRTRNLVRGAGRSKTLASHDRIREAVVNSRAPAEATAAHLALARAWEKEPEAEPARVAYHFIQAGENARAVPWLEAAAERAAAALAFDRAAELYQRALAGIARDDPHRQALYAHLGSALQNAGRREDAARAYLAAAKRAEGATKNALRLRAGEQWLTGGFMTRGLAELRALGVSIPRGVLVSVFRALVPIVALASVRKLHPFVHAPAENEERRARCDTYWSAGIGLGLLQPVHAAYFGCRSALDSLALRDSARIARSLCAGALTAAALGLRSFFDRLSRLTAEAAAHQGTREAEFYAEACGFVGAYLLEQDFRGCVIRGAHLQKLWREAGLGRRWEVDTIDLFTAWALFHLGDLRALRVQHDTLIVLARRGANPFLEVSLRSHNSMLFLAQDDPDGAEEDLDDALSTWSADGEHYQLPHVWATFGRADILLYCDALERRVELARDLSRVRASWLDRVDWIGVRRNHLLARLALAEAARGAGSERQRALKDAQRWLKALGANHFNGAVAWAALIEAGVLHLTGKRAEALAALEKATVALEKREMRLYEHAARFRLGQLEGGPAGEHRCAAAARALGACGVTNVPAMLRVLAPGFDPKPQFTARTRDTQP